jgi:shikimate kinase
MGSNVVIIGFMGVGKTELSKALSVRLGMKYMDTDSMIESEEKRSISDIFERDGEGHFRDLETKLLDKLAGIEGHVISTGGGMVLRDANVKKLKGLGPLILLKSKPEIIEKRLLGAKNRPLLDEGDRGGKIRNMLKDRSPIYDRVADFSIDTSELSIDAAVDGIANFVKGDKR